MAVLYSQNSPPTFLDASRVDWSSTLPRIRWLFIAQYLHMKQVEVIRCVRRCCQGADTGGAALQLESCPDPVFQLSKAFKVIMAYCYINNPLWAWRSMVWNTPLAILGQLSWPCSCSASCASAHQWNMGCWKVLDFLATARNISVLSKSFS